MVNPLLQRALTQEVPNAQQIGHEVLIDGEDYATNIESIFLKAEENRITQTCQLVIIGKTPASVVVGSSIEIKQSFKFDNGTQFTNSIFTGSIRMLQPAAGSRQTSTNITAFDAAESKLSNAPKNSTWTGTNADLIRSELLNLGFMSIDLKFEEISLTAAGLTGFSTVRELVLAAASAIDECVVYLDPNGILCVRSISTLRQSGITLPTTGYTYLQEIANANDRYSTVTVQGSTGASGSAVGTGAYTYEFTSAFPLTSVQCAAKATAIAARAERMKRSCQIPVNPLLKMSSVFQVYDETTLRTCRLTGNSQTIQWTSTDSSPGAWAVITMEDMPE